jgi:hypothetical protein
MPAFSFFSTTPLGLIRGRSHCKEFIEGIREGLEDYAEAAIRSSRMLMSYYPTY